MKLTKQVNPVLVALLARYMLTSAAHSYIVGFDFDGDAYMIKVAELATEILKLDRESSKNGGTLKIRMDMNNMVKVALIENGEAQYIGKTADILALRKNKGEAFEKFITEMFGQEWHKDSVPYYKDGDITVNGERIQIKWENASLTNENVIAKAEAWKLAR